VASDPTKSPLIYTLAADADKALPAINCAPAAAQLKCGGWLGKDEPDHAADRVAPVIVDVDATS
jgi:hypothetical protein